VYAIHKLNNSIWNKKKMTDQWKESITVQIPKKADKADCNLYCEILQILTSYETLSNIFLTRLLPYADKIIGNHQ
jgi:NurA-like 5'-3' nuclease